MSRNKAYHTKINRGSSTTMNLLLKRRMEEHALGDGNVKSLEAEDEAEYTTEFIRPFEREETSDQKVVLSEFPKDEIDPQVQEKLEREFEIYAEHKIKLIDQGTDLIPNVKRRPPTKEEKKDAFIKKRDKFLKRMQRSEHNFWGTDKYDRLLEKWFPDYTLVLENKVSEVQKIINDSITDFNQKIADVIEVLEKVLINATEKNISTALRLINDTETYLTNAVKSKDNAVMTLNGFPESKTRDFLPQYDVVLDRYRELIQNLQVNIGDLESDKSRFKAAVSELSQQKDYLANFNQTIQNTFDVVELVYLQNSEFAALIESTEKIIKETSSLESTAAIPDEAAVQTELDAGKTRISELNTELVKITGGVSSVYWGKGVYYNEEVDALYIVATTYSAAHKYTLTRKFDGFWFFVDSETGRTSGIQQRDSVKKFNQMNYTYSDALIDELYIVSQNKALRDKAKAEHEIGTTFTLLVKSVQDKLFKKRPFHYGMYTKQTRDKVLEYINFHHQEEDLQSDMSTNQSAYYNLTPFYTEDYFTSSQVDAINMLYDTKTLFELLYAPRAAYARFSPAQRKREIEGAIKCRNLFPTWTLQQWITFMYTGNAPDGVYVASPIWDTKKWPTDSKKKYYIARSYHESAGSNPWSPSWEPMFKILFALENTKNYGPLVDGRIDSYWEFEKALEIYKYHLDDGKSLKEHIKEDYIEVSFKGSYEKFLWKRAHEMMDQGKKDLKSEFSKYGSVTTSKVSVGKAMKGLAADLKPIYDLIKKADFHRKEARKEHYYSSDTYIKDEEKFNRNLSWATKYEMQAVQKFKKLIPVHPMLGSIEFEIQDVNSIYKSEARISGTYYMRSSELSNIAEFVEATQENEENAVKILYEIYKDRSSDIRKLETMLKEKPERVWQLHNAIEQTKADLGFDPDSSYATMINHWKSEYAEDKDFWVVVSQIGLGLLTIIFPVIAPITVPVIITISTVEFAKHYDQYQFEEAASGGTYNKEDALGGPPPSVIWLVIDVIGIALDVIDLGILARSIARSAKEAKLMVDGSLVINKKNIDLYRSKLDEYLDVKNLKNPADKDKIIAKLTDEIQLREAQRLESEKVARTNLLQSRTRSQLGEIPEHVIKLFKQPEIGEVMEAGAHRLKEMDLYDYAVTSYAPSYHIARHLKLGKLFMIAGESDGLATALSKVIKAIESKGGKVLTIENFLDYALGGNTTQYQKFFRNIEKYHVTQKQLDEAAEIAIKSSTPEKAAQLFYDEIMNIADKNKAFTRNQLESITVVNKDDQKRMIDDQIEQNRKIKEELDGGSKENGKLDESSLDKINGITPVVKRVGVNKFGATEVSISRVQKLHGVPKKGTPPNHIDDLMKDFKTNGYNLENGPPIEGFAMPDGQIIIIDGHHRLAALERLGETNIPIRIHPEIADEGLRKMLKIGEYSGFYPPSKYPSNFKVPDFGNSINYDIDMEAEKFVRENF